MAFGQQSGPPASSKQIKYLESLVLKAGHSSFRDARGPLGLTQRQAGGKFTTSEASALIDRLVNGGEGDETEVGIGDGPTGEQLSAADRLDNERATILRGMPAGLLASELERRGWTTTPPA